MKLAKEELKDGCVYMVGCVEWGFKRPYIWENSIFHIDTNDYYDGDISYKGADTIEHVNGGQVDTLQELIDYCKDNNHTFIVDCNDTVEAIQKKYLRQPKLKEITLCKAWSAYSGETIDNIKQLVKATFSGEDLMEFIEVYNKQIEK